MGGWRRLRGRELDEAWADLAAADAQRADEHALLVLHGMGGSDELMRPVAGAALRRGIASHLVSVTLPGHGAPLDGAPTYPDFADHVAGIVGGFGEVTILGHSLGGVVGLEYAASPAGSNVVRTVALGVKVQWTDEELEQAAAVATRPMRVFATRAEAVERARRVAGIPAPDAVHPDALHAVEEFLASSVDEVDGGWRPVFDPRTLAIGRPEMGRLVAEAHGEVVLARGEHDPMQTDDQLAALVEDPVTLPGLGHAAHLEDPAAVAALLR